MGPYPRPNCRPRPPYRGNPIILARIPPIEWNAVHDYAEQNGVTISEVIRDALAAWGVIQPVITTVSSPRELSADAPSSQPPRQPPSGARTGQPPTIFEALAAGHYDKPRPGLRDVRPGSYSLGLPRKLPRSEVRPYDRVAEQARRTGPKPPPTLVDPGRRRP